MRARESFKCAQCGEVKPVLQAEGGTGYARRAGDDALVCYACCGANDARELAEAQPGARFVHYLTKENGNYVITNWPGTLKVHPFRVRHGRHNIGRTRTDAWFSYAGKAFHAVNIGDNQIARIRALKP